MPSRFDDETPPKPSILDRLITETPGARQAVPRTARQIFRGIQEGVRRDVENLLNTRWRYEPQRVDRSALTPSLVNYGIPDFTAAGTDASQNVSQLLEVIGEALRQYEPRLKSVRLKPVSGVAADRTFRFRIEAVLHVEPWEDRIELESQFEPATGDFLLKQVGR